MFSFYNFLSSIHMLTGYCCLLSKPMKFCYYFYIFLYFYLLHVFIFPFSGQFGTFFIVIGGSIIIYIGCNKSFLDIIFSLTGYLIAVFLNHLYTIPLSILGFPLTYIQENYMIPSLLILIALNILLLSSLKRCILIPCLSILQTCPSKLLLLFLVELYIGISLLAINFIYGETVSYPTEVLSMNGIIITVFTLSTILIFYSMYGILRRNHELTLQQAQAEIMQDYTNRMESFYDEIRVFRHDYRNILATMQDYIDNGDIEELQKYYHDKILADTKILSDDGFFLGKLHLIEDPAVKSLLYTKLITILNHKLSLTLELTESVPVISIDNLLLCRVLGILLDNAIEASLASEDKLLHLAIICTDTATTFVIANSTVPLKVPVSRLSEQGFTTKERHSGLGLFTVSRLLDPLPQVSLFTEYQNQIFRQTLEIQKGSNTYDKGLFM